VLRDEVPNVLFIEVLDGILLQDERDLSATLEDNAVGIRVDFKRWFIGIAGEGVLDRLGVLGSSGRGRRDIDLICNEEGAIETKSECTNEVSASALVAFGLEQEVSGLSPAYYSTNVPVAMKSDVPDFAGVPMLVWSSWGVMPTPVSASMEVSRFGNRKL